jgi:hypothetical protein
MESVPEFINSIIMAIFPTEIAYGIIILGFGIFFLHFYGTEEWKNFSDLEKIIFSIVTGWLLWFLVIFPISMGIETLNLFFTYTTDFNIHKKSIDNFYVYSAGVFIYFFIWRLYSDTALFKNGVFVSKTTNLIKYLIYLMFPPLSFIFASFYSSMYKNTLKYPVWRILGIIILLINLYIIFLKIHGNLKFDWDRNLINRLKNIFIEGRYKKMLKSFSTLTIVLILISGLIGYVVGTNFYNYNITNEEVRNISLGIPSIVIGFDRTLSGSLLINNQFTLKFGLIKWASIPRNFTITEAYNSDDVSKKYKFSENSVIVRGGEKMDC